MISNDSLAGNRTPIRHQLCSLIGLSHVTLGNTTSLQIVVAIVWLGMRIATFPRFAISLSQNCRFTIVWQALFTTVLGVKYLSRASGPRQLDAKWTIKAPLVGFLESAKLNENIGMW